MRIVQGRNYENLLKNVIKAYTPAEEIPEEFQIRIYGVDTLKAGIRLERHYHDCDEWWIVIDGEMEAESGNEKQVAGPGSLIYTPMGEEHALKPLTDTTLLWFEGLLKGEKRSGHLHRDPAEAEYMHKLINGEIE